MRVRDVMSRPVYPVRADTPVEQAAALLFERGFAAAPVVGAYGSTLVDGVALVYGQFDDEVERQVVTVLVRTVPGVVDARTV